MFGWTIVQLVLFSALFKQQYTANMQFFAIVSLALVAVVAADVSHLANTYLPPTRTHYTAPVVHHAAPVVHRVAPVVHHAAPVVHNVAPAVTHYTAPAVSSLYSAPVATSHYSHVGAASFEAPAFAAAPAVSFNTESFSAPATTFTSESAFEPAASFQSASFAAPAVAADFLGESTFDSAAVSVDAPVVAAASYSAPVVSHYTAPAVTRTYTSGIDTTYGSNGGYVYNKRR
ncbi:cuticle protein 16.5 [Drosophila busckii]|nr:cuticle protein 16.5 [Drosophila busckii]